MTATANLAPVAARVRGRVLDLSHRAGIPHVGSALSCVDLLVALYWTSLRIDPRAPQAPERDRFLLSKGHAAAALYAVLAERGFIPAELLATFAEDGSRLPEHPAPQCVPGVEWATGSLGHGLSAAAGLALGAHLRRAPCRTVALLSDGECNAGQVWEAALFAAAHRLGSLTAIIDYNKWQATGRSDEVLALRPLADKWRAFGWETVEIDGHDLDAIASALRRAELADRGQPLAIVAHTVKGRGVSFMEDDNNWHYRVPDAGEVRAARAELGLA